MPLVASAQTVGNDTVKTELAFRLIPETQGGMMTFAVVTHKNGQIINSRVITMQAFVLRGMGLESSEANPENRNFFKEFDVPCCFYAVFDHPKIIEYIQKSCRPPRDTMCNRFSYETEDLVALPDIWRLRYSRDPRFSRNMQVDDENKELKGWAREKHHPSWGQIQILQRYGVENYTDFICGPNAFRLFKDLCDENWLLNYKHTE